MKTFHAKSLHLLFQKSTEDGDNYLRPVFCIYAQIAQISPEWNQMDCTPGSSSTGSLLPK